MFEAHMQPAKGLPTDQVEDDRFGSTAIGAAWFSLGSLSLQEYHLERDLLKT
jgi:DNA-binding transcriptional regulator WhiA